MCGKGVMLHRTAILRVSHEHPTSVLRVSYKRPKGVLKVSRSLVVKECSSAQKEVRMTHFYPSTVLYERITSVLQVS